MLIFLSRCFFAGLLRAMTPLETRAAARLQAGRYRQIQATGTALADYYASRQAASMPEPAQPEATKDLPAPPRSTDLPNVAAGRVKAILAQVERGKSLTPEDAATLTAVVADLVIASLSREEDLIASGKRATADPGNLVQEGVAPNGPGAALEAVAARIKTTSAAGQRELLQLALASAAALGTHDQQIYDELQANARNLHDRSDTVVHSQELPLTRLGKISALFKDYKALGEHLEASIRELNRGIKALDCLLEVAIAPQAEELRKQYEQLLARKESLVALWADFALTERADTAEMFRGSDFKGYRAAMYGVDRAGLQTEGLRDLGRAGASLKAEIVSLRASTGHEALVSLLQTKLAQVQVQLTAHNLARGALAWTDRLEDNQVARRRAELLRNLTSQIDQLAVNNGLEALMTQALAHDPAVSWPARARLGEVRDVLVKAVEKWREAYARLGPAREALHVLGWLVDRLNAYDFACIADIDSFADQAGQVHREELARTLASLEKAGAMRKPEADLLRDIEAAIATYFDDVDLQEKKLQAIRYDFVDRMARAADRALPELAGLAELRLENPDAPPVALETRRDELASELQRTRDGYAAWLETAPGDQILDRSRQGLAADNPEVKILDLLIARTSKLPAGQPADTDALDRQLEEQLALLPTSTAERKSLQHLVTSVRAVGVALTGEARVIGTCGSEAAARRVAARKARETPSLAFGVLHLGWHEGRPLGFRVVAYPAAAFERKQAQARDAEGNLVHVVMASGEELIEGGKNVAGEWGGDFQAGPLAAVADDEAREHRVLEQIGDRARRLVVSHYDEAIRAYRKLLGKDDKLLTMLKAARGEIAAMDARKAAFVLSRDFPAVRVELYRQMGFTTAPDKGMPPCDMASMVDAMARNRQFASTAEMIFVRRAGRWADWETTPAITKTAGIVAGTAALGQAGSGAGGSVAIQ